MGGIAAFAALTRRAAGARRGPRLASHGLPSHLVQLRPLHSFRFSASSLGSSEPGFYDREGLAPPPKLLCGRRVRAAGSEVSACSARAAGAGEGRRRPRRGPPGQRSRTPWTPGLSKLEVTWFPVLGMNGETEAQRRPGNPGALGAHFLFNWRRLRPHPRARRSPRDGQGGEVPGALAPAAAGPASSPRGGWCSKLAGRPPPICSGPPTRGRLAGQRPPGERHCTADRPAEPPAAGAGPPSRAGRRHPGAEPTRRCPGFWRAPPPAPQTHLGPHSRPSERGCKQPGQEGPRATCTRLAGEGTTGHHLRRTCCVPSTDQALFGPRGQ